MKPALSSTLKKIALVSAGSFVFAFSLVPLYRIACEKVFGIKLEAGAADAARVGDMRADESRTVRVEFDANVNSKLPWSFAPKTLHLDVQPGKAYEVNYIARNESDAAIVGNAAPSVAPTVASGYFNKTECFCFTEQLLAAGEERLMPVRFIVSPDLPDNVQTLTLSYTFFSNDVATAKLVAAAPKGSGARSAP
ncbi:MAG TPA: cytochrome c oxidase assembly protein [Arenimonas sp.]|nr:cytochrome c oxidase assembly protein [Arenimonas sp.]